MNLLPHILNSTMLDTMVIGRELSGDFFLELF